MATKKQNRHYIVRRVRRALNRVFEPFKMSGRKLNQSGWGRGIKETDISKNHGIIE